MEQVTIITKHGKDQILADIFAKAGFELIKFETNTDQFGTFTGDTPRLKDQIQTAKDKILQTLDQITNRYILSSEGAFFPDPRMPLLPLNRELIVLYDREQDIWIVGEAASHETNYDGIWAESVDQLLDFAHGVEFPQSRVILSTQPKSAKNWKDAQTHEELRDQWSHATGWFTKKLWVETDMRADRNHLRPSVIQEAARDCLASWDRTCPSCSARGFRVQERLPGLPCEYCSAQTQVIRAVRYVCDKCLYTEERPTSEKLASAGECEVCNP